MIQDCYHPGRPRQSYKMVPHIIFSLPHFLKSPFLAQGSNMLPWGGRGGIKLVCKDRKTNDTTDFQNWMCEPSIGSSLHQALLTERSSLNPKGSSQSRAEPGGQGPSELQEKPWCRALGLGHPCVGRCCKTGRQGREPPCRERESREAGGQD